VKFRYILAIQGSTQVGETPQRARDGERAKRLFNQTIPEKKGKRHEKEKEEKGHISVSFLRLLSVSWAESDLEPPGPDRISLCGRYTHVARTFRDGGMGISGGSPAKNGRQPGGLAPHRRGRRRLRRENG